MPRSEEGAHDRDPALEAIALQAQKFEAVGRLANLIAHDFNNLLTIIHGYAGLVLRGKGGPERQAARLEEIQQAAESAAHLSRQLSALSRRNGGVRSDVDLNLVVRGTEALVRRVRPVNVTMELRLSESAELVHADPGELEQVLLCLVTNAIDAMPAGGHLLVETASARDAGTGEGAKGMTRPMVTLTVQDNGCGMDATTQERCLEPLFTTKPAHRGSGLGLSSVKAIVDALGGHLAVDTSVGRGTSVLVRLPRVEASTVAALTRGAPAPESLVLVVEPQAAVRAVVASLLKEAGYRVEAAGTAAEARRLAGESTPPPSLLLTEAALADGDGPSLVGDLRQRHAALGAVVMTGSPEPVPALSHAAEMGFEVLHKPFGARELLTALAGAPAAADLARAAMQPPE